MSENDPREAAADPPSDHETPGGQPEDHTEELQTPETEIETPGGTTVTEKPSEDK